MNNSGPTTLFGCCIDFTQKIQKARYKMMVLQVDYGDGNVSIGYNGCLSAQLLEAPNSPFLYL
jgi:hypothetical protein